MMPLQFSQPGQQLTLDYMESFIKPDDDRYSALCDQVQLRSHFQPIYSLAHQRVVGFEALVRPSLIDGGPITPLTLFSEASTLEQSVFIDRMCRTLHVSNFMQQADDTTWLFLNLNPLTTMYGKQFGPFFKELLQRYGVPAHRIVIEILEAQIDDEELLAESIDYYRDMGCLIAIDDFGVGHSNFNRIWRIAPQIVKLDKTLIDQAVSNRSVRRVLPELVSLIHQAGALALIEGVETEQQAMIAVQSDIDFVQGFFFSKPHKDLQGISPDSSISQLFTNLREDHYREELASKQKLTPYTKCFFDVVMKILDGDEPQKSLQIFLELPGVSRCYFLDAVGIQVGQNYLSESCPNINNPHFAPLNDTRNAIWSRRHYFQSAIAEPGLIQVSKPYLSITGGDLCITLSIAINTANGMRVLCGDVTWADN
jgi:EAL domain-containing protein (putative c-di-GMP-specific phosphodiesterase class I)